MPIGVFKVTHQGKPRFDRLMQSLISKIALFLFVVPCSM